MGLCVCIDVFTQCYLFMESFCEQPEAFSSNQLFMKVINEHNCLFIAGMPVSGGDGGQFSNFIHMMDVEGKLWDMRTPNQKQAAFLLLIARKSLRCRCDSNSKTYFEVLSHEVAVSISNHTKELAGGRGGETLENHKHHLSVLVEHGSYLWIPLPQPHQSKSTALLSVVILVWFLFFKRFQHVGL